MRILEFSSYTCSHCASFTLNKEPLLDEHYLNRGLASFVSMHFPLDRHAFRASEAVEAAGMQGAFWPYYRQLMARQQSLLLGGYADDQLAAIALDLGLDVARFRSDLNSDAPRKRVEAAVAEGKRRSIPSVPTFFINEKVIRGDVPFVEFQAAIEGELTRAGRR